MLVFLGNPGTRYERTRHNVGRTVLGELVGTLGLPDPDGWKEKFHGRFLRREEQVFLLPETYMNESGRSVQAATAFFGFLPTETLVVHDDLETPFGTLHLAFAGGHRGNNGVRSVAQHLGTAEFWRLRVGIGRPPTGRKPGDWVLERFSTTEEAELPALVRAAARVITANTSSPREQKV